MESEEREQDPAANPDEEEATEDADESEEADESGQADDDDSEGHLKRF